MHIKGRERKGILSYYRTQTFTVLFNVTLTVKLTHTQLLKKHLCTEWPLPFSTPALSSVMFSHCQRLVFLPTFSCFIRILTFTFIHFCGIFLLNNILETLNIRNSFSQFAGIYYLQVRELNPSLGLGRNYRPLKELPTFE